MVRSALLGIALGCAMVLIAGLTPSPPPAAFCAGLGPSAYHSPATAGLCALPW